MRCKIALPFFLFVFFFSSVSAQFMKSKLQPLLLNSFDAFQSPSSNWKLVGAVQSAYQDTFLTTAKGSGIVYNEYKRSIQFQPGHHLVTKMEHGDMYFECDVMLPRKTNSGIYFQSRYEVQLNDSWGVKSPRYSDMGGIYERASTDGKGFEGSSPMQNAAKAPGLWQHLEVSFEAPKFDKNGKKTTPAKFNFVKLNGVVIHENIFVSGPTRSAAFENEKPYGPLMIQGDHGPIAIKNIKYAPQEVFNATLSDISYKYYEKTAQSLEEAAKTKPTSQGKLNSLDGRVAQVRDNFFLIYDGKINVQVKDKYTFSMVFTGEGSLIIDGKTVINPEITTISRAGLTGSIDLDGGTHSFQIWIKKYIDWERPGLALSVEKSNSRQIALHNVSGIPDRSPAPLISVEPQKETEMIRSFMMQGDKKLTHIVSVGHPSKLHYAYDLMQGGVLKIWKGQFLNTTEMWNQRGEPQTASPLGASIDLPGNSLIFENKNVKDSITALQYKGYTLSGIGNPTFKYEYKTFTLVDQILPNENATGFNRKIDVTGAGKEKLMIRIAQGKNITPVGQGLYAIDNSTYYIQVTLGTLPKMDTYNNNVVLLMPASETIQYQLLW
jgi:hypothetical protein